MKKWDGVGWVVYFVLGVALVACSGDNLGGLRDAPAPRDAKAAPANFVAGDRLAEVKLTDTHTIEFWETEPGNVMLIQAWDSGNGETKLELDELLRDAGGTYSSLYRKLLNDPGASLPAELVAADEHRAHLPIRDAALPLPAIPKPPGVPTTHGTSVVTRTEPTAQPGALQTLGISHIFGGIMPFVDPSWCAQYIAIDADGGWCPPGQYGDFATGNAQETIYWDAFGNNPQAPGGGVDYMTVHQLIGSVWLPVFSYGLWPGHSVEAYTSSTAKTYQGSITGTFVSYAEIWRLSFPALSQMATHPGGPGFVYSGFSNDIQGWSHDAYNWLLSRTEYGISGPKYGVMGAVAWNEDLDQYEPARLEFPEPSAWLGLGFDHFGDIVYDRQSSDTFIALSGQSNGSPIGGIGVWNNGGGYEGAVKVSDAELAWLALNPKTREFYASKGTATSIQRYTLSAYVGSSAANPPVAQQQRDIVFLNAPTISDGVTGIDGIQGGKVSGHGKLWVDTLSSDLRSLIIWGVDPYSGLIQITYAIPTNWPELDLEAEGLDLTDPTSAYDMLPDRLVGGEIHAQLLANSGVLAGNDGWAGLNLHVSDLNRL